MKETIFVIDAPFKAMGDGVTNDREAIQGAIDYVHKQGGGTVVLESGKTFLSGGLVLKSNVTFHFENGATLLQSSDPDDYVKPTETGYEPYRPVTGHNYSETIKWSHAWYKNYPFLFAPEGSHNIKITGSGTVRMMPCVDTDKLMRICPIGFYRVSNFEVSDITIADYHSYAMMPFTCDNGLIKNVTIGEWKHGNCDGICMMNCRDMRITGCTIDSGDDSLYIFQSYRDPRGGEWWSSDEPQPSVNIEIDHNDLKSNNCKAFAMILWGIDCPEQEKVEVRNVYIHDNHFKTMGNWLYNPYTAKNGFPPVTTVRFNNNIIDAIEVNFFETVVSDMNYFHSMKEIQNGSFDDGAAFWAMRKNSDPDSVGAGCEYIADKRIAYGYIDSLEKGDTAVFQGLYINAGKPVALMANVKSSGDTCRLFVRNLDTQELVAYKDFNNTEWCNECLDFTVPESGNYHVGIERGNAESGWARITAAALIGNTDAAFGYKSVVKKDGKIIFYY